jgi:MFS transporter, AAHS family, 4-hydroxybenzoate transporter
MVHDAAAGAGSVDPGQLIDQGRWSSYQKLLVFGVALTIVLDGIDNQLLPNALPTLIREWGQPRAAFTTALAIGPFGMMLGGLLGGILGDRLGRRPALLGSVLTFGAFTAALAFVNSIETLTILRFLAGLGLGGAMPNAATLASEYVSQRHRPIAVTLAIVSIPLGGAFAGEVAALVIPAQGWRMLFTVCGAVSVLVAFALWFVLPESPKFLLRDPRRWPALARVLRRSGHHVPDGVVFTDARERQSQPASGLNLASLFKDGFASDTIAVCASFFLGLMVNYIVVLLLPSLLTSRDVGFSQPTASRALAMWNYGGVVAAVLGAFAVQRIGSRMAMLPMAVGAAVCGGVLAVWPLNPQQPTGLLVLILLAGACVGGVQTTMYALAAHIYPTRMRSTGVGTAVAVGRIGNVIAAYAGSTALDSGGPRAYFVLWAVLMLLVFAALASIRRHVAPTAA